MPVELKVKHLKAKEQERCQEAVLQRTRRLRVRGVREGRPARPSDCLRTPVCRAARGGGRVVVGRRFVWDAREGWTREARRRRAWDGGGRYIVSREVRVKCVCARARG